MPLSSLQKKLQKVNLSPAFAVITRVNATNFEATGLHTGVGDIVRISSQSENLESLGMVTALDEAKFSISPFGFVEGFKIGDRVYASETGLKIQIGDGLLGRVVNPLMKPIDGKGELELDDTIAVIRPPVAAMKRGLIEEVFPVGVKSIDGLLTCGRGQKLGIFAGSGVGK